MQTFSLCIFRLYAGLDQQFYIDSIHFYIVEKRSLNRIFHQYMMRLLNAHSDASNKKVFLAAQEWLKAICVLDGALISQPAQFIYDNATFQLWNDAYYSNYKQMTAIKVVSILGHGVGRSEFVLLLLQQR